ncbi:putative Heat shock protein 70 protein, partial [Trachipleistophora hominis]
VMWTTTAFWLSPAREKGSNKSEKLTVSNSNRKTTPEQLEEMHKKHKEFEEADRKKKENVSAKIEYEAMLYQLNEKVGEVPDQNVKSNLESSLKQHQEWLDTHPNADKEEYMNKKNELMGLLQQVAGSAQGAPGGFDASNFGGAPPHGASEPKVDEVD